MSAIESPSTRLAWYAAEELKQYYAAEIDADGKIAKATQAGQYVGQVQYGAEAEDDMVTVVKGIFPAIATEAIEVGDDISVSATAGVLMVAVTGPGATTVIGKALSAAAAPANGIYETFTLFMY